MQMWQRNKSIFHCLYLVLGVNAISTWKNLLCVPILFMCSNYSTFLSKRDDTMYLYYTAYQ